MARLDWYIRAGLKPRHLQLLVALDDLRQLGKVAAQLNVTQGAVSKTLGELQTELGLTLFERHGRGMAPTAYGECLVRYARGILKQLVDAGDELHALATGVSGKLRVGSLPAASLSLMPRSLALLKAESPSLTVFVREGTTDTLQQQLRAGDIELVVGTLPVGRESHGLEEQVLYDDLTHLVVGCQHPLAGRPVVSWVDLASYPWVMPPPDSLLREPLLGAFRDNALAPPTNYIETLSGSLICNYIQQVDAIACLSVSVARHYFGLGLLNILQLSLPRLVRPVGICWSRAHPLSPASSAFIRCAQRAAEVLNEPSG